MTAVNEAKNERRKSIIITSGYFQRPKRYIQELLIALKILITVIHQCT